MGQYADERIDQSNGTDAPDPAEHDVYERLLDGGLVHLVGLKWLMAGMGFWIDIPRFKRDPRYALACIERVQNIAPASMWSPVAALLPLVRRFGAEPTVSYFRGESTN